MTKFTYPLLELTFLPRNALRVNLQQSTRRQDEGISPTLKCQFHLLIIKQNVGVTFETRLDHFLVNLCIVGSKDVKETGRATHHLGTTVKNHCPVCMFPCHLPLYDHRVQEAVDWHDVDRFHEIVEMAAARG